MQKNHFHANFQQSVLKMNDPCLKKKKKNDKN